jgi:uncharacterized protein YqeY
MTDKIKDKLVADMKSAMRNKATVLLGTIRLVLAKIKQQELDTQTIVDDETIAVILHKMVKQRRVAIKQYQDAQRFELAAKEQEEIAIIQNYLPEELSSGAITELITATITELGASKPADMAKVMRALEPKVRNRVDMALLSKEVQAKLAAIV